jgi:hypothetical protein
MILRYFRSYGPCRGSPHLGALCSQYARHRFLALLAVARGGLKALRLMRDVWQPNDVWSSFIAAQVANANAA